jgi:hypothetical protein
LIRGVARRRVASERAVALAHHIENTIKNDGVQTISLG